mgnify:CR=1 FL=1
MHLSLSIVIIYIKQERREENRTLLIAHFHLHFKCDDDDLKFIGREEEDNK